MKQGVELVRGEGPGKMKYKQTFMMVTVLNTVQTKNATYCAL